MLEKSESCIINTAPSILFVGNYLPHSVSSRAVSEDVSRRLEEVQGVGVFRTSSRVGKVARLLDMTATTWRRRHHYQIAHIDVYSGQAFVFADIIGRLLKHLGKPFVLTLHGGNLPNFAASRTRHVARLLQSADIVTAPSCYLQETMQPYRADIRLLPNPIDAACLPYRQRTVLKPHLIWLRAFHSIYNPAMAIEVLHRLLPKFPEMTLFMVGADKGDGSLTQTQRLAKELRLMERITFTGGVPKEEVGSWLDKGDIFLNTTTVDNAPVSVIEAMASGLCVVSTNVGGMPCLIADQDNGLLVPSGDAETMSEAIIHLLSASNFAARLSANAHQSAIKYDWSVILPQWMKLLQSVAQK